MPSDSSGLQGKVDRVDLILNEDSAFRSRWANGFRIQSGQQRRATLSDMLRAFRLNLQALSLLALFVGIFLVYNTAMFAVVSRRKDAGILRSLGANRREVIFAFLSEILFLGALGGALGGIAGYFLSRFLTNLVAGTISNLYFFSGPLFLSGPGGFFSSVLCWGAEPVSSVEFSPWQNWFGWTRSRLSRGARQFGARGRWPGRLLWLVWRFWESV